jgi:hypothetical protein
MKFEHLSLLSTLWTRGAIQSLVVNSVRSSLALSMPQLTDMKMKFLITLLCALSGVAVFGELEIRDVAFEPKPKFTEVEYDNGIEKKKVYLGDVAFITSDDVEDAFTQIAGTSTFQGEVTQIWGIFVKLTDSGAEKMKNITEKRINQRMAFLIDGEIVSLPTVTMPLSKSLTITGFSKDKAEDLEGKIISSRRRQPM